MGFAGKGFWNIRGFGLWGVRLLGFAGKGLWSIRGFGLWGVRRLGFAGKGLWSSRLDPRTPQCITRMGAKRCLGKSLRLYRCLARSSARYSSIVGLVGNLLSSTVIHHGPCWILSA